MPLIRPRARRIIQPAIYAAAGAGPGGFSLVAGGTQFSANTSATTIDFGTTTYPAGATRIVIAAQWYGSGTLTGVTIGGVALTQIVGAHVVSGGVSVDFWESSAPLSGSSGDVQVTFSAAQGYIASVALYGLTTTTPAASAAITATFNPTVASATINIPAGGGALFATNGVNGHTATFTNAVADNDITAGGTNQYYGHTTVTGAGITVTATYSASDAGVLSVVAWAP